MLLEGVEKGDDGGAFGGGQDSGFSHGIVGSGHHGWCSDFQSHDGTIVWVFGLIDVRGDAVFPVIGVDVSTNLGAVVW